MIPRGRKRVETREDNLRVETVRSTCFDLAAAAFSSNQIDLERYEAVAGEIASAEQITDLEAIQGRLPQVVQPPPVKSQLINAESSNLRREGRWLDTLRVKLHGAHSNIRLDFTAYAMEDNLRVEVELDCRSSNVRLVVPRSIDVIERIESNRMSVYRDRRRPSATNSAIILTGNIASTNVRIKRKKVR